MDAKRDRRWLVALGSVLVVGVLAVGAPAWGQVFEPDVHGVGLSMADYLRKVPGGGQPNGPAYNFWMGQYEITNAQFAGFLNDAQLDGGATGRGSNMLFLDNGNVRLTGGIGSMFHVSNTGIAYDPSAPVGQRYSTGDFGDGVDLGVHPVGGVTWYGALKFSNWLTLDQGLGTDQRVYHEGPTPEEWHPMSISTPDWQTRDLTAAERLDLVQNYQGFRLPMDQQAETAAPFNEFYKAAAWDPAAGVNHQFAFGRDVIDHRDANGASLNPNKFELDDPWQMSWLSAPVGFYDGSLQLQEDWNWPLPPFPEQGFDFDEFQTRVNANAFGIYDLSGNVEEWMQDRFDEPSANRSVRGGSFTTGPLTTDYRVTRGPFAANRFGGFRIIRIPEPSTILLLAGAAPLIIRRIRRH